MGIINLDPIETPFGCSHTGAYMSTTDSQLIVNKNRNSKFVYSCMFNIYISKSAKDAGKPAIGQTSVKVLSDAPLGADVYTILYDQLKIMYPNYQDDN